MTAPAVSQSFKAILLVTAIAILAFGIFPYQLLLNWLNLF